MRAAQTDQWAVVAMTNTSTCDLLARGVAEFRLDEFCTLKWCRGEMSNFDYLMHLNTLAGRRSGDGMSGGEDEVFAASH